MMECSATGERYRRIDDPGNTSCARAGQCRTEENFILSRRFDDAFQFAHERHRGQLRKGTPISYLMTVAALVLEHGGAEDQAIAALLHDGPEDCGGAVGSPGPSGRWLLDRRGAGHPGEEMTPVARRGEAAGQHRRNR